MSKVFCLSSLILSAVFLSNAVAADNVLPRIVSKYNEVKGVEVLEYAVRESEYVKEIVEVKGTFWTGNILLKKDGRCSVVKQELITYKKTKDGITMPETTLVVRSEPCPSAGFQDHLKRVEEEANLARAEIELQKNVLTLKEIKSKRNNDLNAQVQ